MALGLEEARKRLLDRLLVLREEDARAVKSTTPVTLEQDSVGRLSRIDAMQMQAIVLAGTAWYSRLYGARASLPYGHCGRDSHS